MRSVNATFDTAIAGSELKIAELYEIELQTAVKHYFTSYQVDVTWNGIVYSALPIQRSALSLNSNLEPDSVEITLGNISGAFYQYLDHNILEAAKITIKRIVVGSTYSTDNEIILFIGTADVNFNRQTLQLTCKSILDNLNIQVPKNIYQEPCNNQLFDVSCGLTQANYKTQLTTTALATDRYQLFCSALPVYKVQFDTGNSATPVVFGETITGGAGSGTAKVVCITYDSTGLAGYLWYVSLSGTQFVDNEVVAHGAHNVKINGTPAVDEEFYVLGEVKITSGVCSGQRRMVIEQTGMELTVASPFTAEIASGITFDLYSGCDKSGLCCRNRFNNETNFHGYIYIPKVEDATL